MIQIRGETEARRAAKGGIPLSFRALLSPILAAVGLTAGVGVPLAGVMAGVGEVCTVGVTVGDVATVGVTVGDVATVGVTVGDVATVGVTVGVDLVGEGFGVTETGGRPTGVLCGPPGLGVPVCVPPGVEAGTGDELATALFALATT